MVILKAQSKIKIKKGLVELPDELNKITSHSFIRMIINPDLKFKFALKHNLDIRSLDNEELFASYFVGKNYSRWLEYSKASRNLIIGIYTEHPRLVDKDTFDRFIYINNNIPLFNQFENYPEYTITNMIFNCDFTVDFINSLTSSPNFQIQNISPFIFKNILLFCLMFHTFTSTDEDNSCDDWRSFKLPLQEGDVKERSTYKSIMSSFIHAQQNWFLYLFNFHPLDLLIPKLNHTNTAKLLNTLSDFSLLFPFLNIISYIKHIECMPVDTPYLKIKAFITAVEYLNSKVKDTMGPSGLAPFFEFTHEKSSSDSKYVTTQLLCNLSTAEYEDFEACLSRIINPIHSSLNNSVFSFIDPSVYFSSEVMNFTSSFKKSIRDTYVFGFQEHNSFHRAIKDDKKSPLFSGAFTDKHFTLARHSISQSLYSLNSSAIFKDRILNIINEDTSLNGKPSINSYFKNMLNLLDNPCSFSSINIDSFAPFFLPYKTLHTSKPISDAPVAPLNWLNNNLTVSLIKSEDFKDLLNAPAYLVKAEDTYNHLSATNNGINMNNCIDRFTLPVSSGITEVIVFSFHPRSHTTLEQKNLIKNIISRYKLESEIDNFITTFELTNHLKIAYEGGIRHTGYNDNYNYYQYNAYSNYNYTLNSYMSAGKFVSADLSFYSIFSNYLLSLPIDEATAIFDSPRIKEVENIISLLVSAQKGILLSDKNKKPIQDILDALEIISTISEAYLLESFYQQYLTDLSVQSFENKTESLVHTLCFVSIDNNSIYLNPSKTPALYSYTDFFRTSDFIKPKELDFVNVSISTIETIPVTINLHGNDGDLDNHPEDEYIPF